MKTLLKILPILLLAACGTEISNKSVAELTAKRDSLQNVQNEISLKIVKLNEQISLKDTSNSEEELKLIKKIAMQKGRVVKLEKGVKKLENELESIHKEKKKVPVRVKELKLEPFNHYIIVYGRVEAKKYANISPEMGGRINKIYVKEGQWVNKNELLVSLNTDAVNKQIEGVKSGLELAQNIYSKQSTLWEKGVGSEIEYLTAKNTVDNLQAQLETLQAQLRMSQIKAPFDGLVNKIYSKVGELTSPAAPLVEFVNLTQLEVNADVSEAYIGSVKMGDIVQVTFASLEDTLKAPIRKISSIIDQKSRTFEIGVNVTNRDNIYKPNMVSTILINDFSSDTSLVVPTDVIGKDITGNYVYIIKNDIVAKRYVKTSLSYNEKTRIASGLNAGDIVITQGYHLVSSGINVNVVE